MVKQTLILASLFLVTLGSALAQEKAPEDNSLLLPIMNAALPFDQILTAGQPTPDQLEQAKARGYKAVINLRTGKENPSPEVERKWVEGLGMRYISLPVDGKKGVTKENALKLADYLKDSSLYPLIVHCYTSNRTGAIFAIKAFHVDGKSADQSLEVGKKAGLKSLAGYVRKQLNR